MKSDREEWMGKWSQDTNFQKMNAKPVVIATNTPSKRMCFM